MSKEKAEKRIVELVNEIPVVRREIKELSRKVSSQILILEKMPHWAFACNRGAKEISALTTAQQGNLNHGEFNFLRESFPKELKSLEDYGENLMVLNNLSNKLEKLETELSTDYRLTLD